MADLSSILEFALNRVRVAAFLVDERARFHFVNEEACRSLGRSREDLLRMAVPDVSPRWSAALWEQHWRELKRDGALIHESVHRRRDGHLFPVEVNSNYFEYDGGQYNLALVRDISECKEAEERVQEGEDKFRLIFESASDCMLLLSLEGRIVDINHIGHQGLGYEKEEMLGRNIAEFDPPEFAAQVPEKLATLKSAGQVSFESARVRKDGTVMPIEINARIVDLAGQPTCLSVIRDITERKRAEAALREREAKYRAVTEGSADGFWVIDPEGRIIEVNDAYVRLTGYDREELLALRVADLVGGGRPEETAARIAGILEAGHDRFESVYRRKDGEMITLEVSAAAVAGDGKKFLYNSARDITQRKRAEEELRLMSLVYQHGSDAMTVTDADNRIVAVNPAFTKITGYAAEEVLGKNPSVLSSGCQDEAFYRAMWQAINFSGHWQGEIWNRRKTGEVYPEWLTINTIYNDDGSVSRRVAMFSDISQRKASEELAWRQSNFDMLTQLPNRRMFWDRLEQCMKKTHRTDDEVALLFIDLDKFKEINEVFGHNVGDDLLAMAAKRITKCVRESDTVARMGGDEFAVILAELHDESHAERAAHKIVESLSEPFHLQHECLYLSASIGVTLYPNDGTDTAQLLKNAEQAMYVAKNRGRNRYAYFTPAMQEAAEHRAQLLGDLRAALPANQFRAFFQPIVELATGRIIKAEALLRWQHPVRGLVSPLDFIPLTEETGLIKEIGSWIGMESARWVKRWDKLCPDGFQVSVNRSPIEFSDDNDLRSQAFLDYLQELGLSGKSFVIEITEGLLLDADQRILDQFLALRDAGIQVAIDDFGTGYSSLAYLKRFDIDYLKIDRAFVNNLESDADDQALVEAIVMMAHKLGLKVIAEGIETEGQRELLSRSGCDYGQGHLFSKAVPPEEFEALLRGE